ncbi:alpha-glucosidase C-terminal domain-containing protein [Persicobacter diffluens]|uniref:Glycosyl hydrolase family 13 catalytic domain-containing protein n=1 Tax=Persicobacter diffluens TaxID=981 RepID=A0AAN4W4I5_9BACT|nr:hypothetical protein PEDI_50550 [Persicobacter diffluens]
MFQQALDDELAVEGSFGTRSGNRTPMQWDQGENWGFSTASADQLYLPMPTDKTQPSVAAQQKHKESLFYRVKALIELRKSEPALGIEADYDILYAKKDQYPLIFTRKLDKEEILVVLNPSAEKQKVSIGIEASSRPKSLMGGGVKLKAQKGQTVVECEGRCYQIFKLRNVGI